MNNKTTVGMIFAAGLGTRLAPVTDTLPKALVPVGGIPMLEQVIRNFMLAGVTKIVVNVHHHSSQIIEFLRQNNNFGAEISVSDESDNLLDTGGALKKAAPLLADADNILIHNADILTDLNLKELLDFHVGHYNDATLLVSKRDSSRLLYFDRNNMNLAGWEDLKKHKVLPDGFNPRNDDSDYIGRAFNGIHVISSKTLKSLVDFTDKSVFSIIPFYVAQIGLLRIKGFLAGTEYSWHDIGSIDKLHEAEKWVKQTVLDRRYLRMAAIWAENSYCNRRKVGAIIVKDKMIISDGYNGTPAGFENVCEDDGGATKPYVLHAEANALTKVARTHNSSDGATLYVTSSPCLECSKLIIQSGIRRVVYSEKYRLEDGLELLKRAGIECLHLPDDNRF